MNPWRFDKLWPMRCSNLYAEPSRAKLEISNQICFSRKSKNSMFTFLTCLASIRWPEPCLKRWLTKPCNSCTSTPLNGGFIGLSTDNRADISEDTDYYIHWLWTKSSSRGGKSAPWFLACGSRREVIINQIKWFFLFFWESKHVIRSFMVDCKQCREGHISAL